MLSAIKGNCHIVYKRRAQTGSPTALHVGYPFARVTPWPAVQLLYHDEPFIRPLALILPLFLTGRRVLAVPHVASVVPLPLHVRPLRQRPNQLKDVFDIFGKAAPKWA